MMMGLEEKQHMNVLETDGSGWVRKIRIQSRED